MKVFKNIGKLVTLSSAARKGGRSTSPADLAAIENAVIVEDKGRIVYVGDSVPARYRRTPSVSLKGATVVPGLVECHTHLVYAGNRSAEFERRNQGESYQSIAASGGGILSTVKLTREASERELTQIGQRRVDRFLRQGVTTVEVKSGYGLTLRDELKMLTAARALKNARIVPTYLGAHAVPREFASASDYVDSIIKTLPRVAKLASRVDAFVEKGYFSVEDTRRYLEAARALGMTASIHADQLTSSGGTLLAIEQKASSADHLVQLGSKEIRALAASEVTAVLLPSADLYMDCAYPKAREIIDAGGRVALATDFNPGTAPSQDVALVGILARVRMKMSFAETLVAYTIGGAHALGLEKEIGSIDVGKSCDFNVLTGEIDEMFLDVGHMPIARTFYRGREVGSRLR